MNWHEVINMQAVMSNINVMRMVGVLTAVTLVFAAILVLNRLTLKLKGA